MNRSKKVLVSGCFDLMHAGHIAFLTEAATYGDLHVCAGADDNILSLKGHEPMFSEGERVYLLNALDCVTEARVSTGRGMLDFIPDMEELKPDVFVVNHDGHTEGKEEACAQRGIEYVVLERVPAQNFPARSSSGTKTRLSLPYRVCLAGGWLDQPWVNELVPGPVITAQLAPTTEFIDRSGMATSTRRTAERIWGRRFPSGDPKEVGKMLFACENPPGSPYISGSQDALGLTLPGINCLHYKSGSYWPDEIESIDDGETQRWLESVLHFVEVGPRPDGYDPLIEKNLTKENAQLLSEAAQMTWQGVKTKDATLLGKGLSQTADAWTLLLPNTVPAHLRELRKQYKENYGTSFSGCGGGYLMVVSDTPPQDAIRLHITSQRKEL